MKVLLVAVVVIVILMYVVAKRNTFNRLQRAVKQQGSDIGIQIAKRSASLNDTLNILRSSYSHEVAGIEKLTAKDQLDQLAFLGQKYPELQFVHGYNQTLAYAKELNDNIFAARELLNGNIRLYNDEISTFPGMLVAALFRYKKEKFVDEDNIEENKKLDKAEVDFSKF